MKQINCPAFLKVVLVMILSALLLCGCGDSENTPPQTTTEAPVATYSVRFVMGGVVCSEQELTEGAYPQAGIPEVQGLTFVQWADDNGNPIDPETQAVAADVTYTALAYPTLDRYNSFLSVNEAGYLRPDEPLTADELYTALTALAADGAEKYFPGMPLGSQKLEQELVQSVLNHFFGETAVAEAFAALPVVEAAEEENTTEETAPVAEEKDYMLRGEFASVM